MRTLITEELFADPLQFWGARGRWPAQWITHPHATTNGAVVQAFRRQLTLKEPQKFRIHVSADERYELWLDGQRLGRGPERGDRLNWYFETYDLTLEAGLHTLVAQTWWLNKYGPAPFAQISICPAFLLATDPAAAELLATGVAPWECKIIEGCYPVSPAMVWGTGAKVHIKGAEYSWDWQRGGGTGWEAPRLIGPAFGPQHLLDQPPLWVLKPATLPPMLERPVFPGTARHIQKLEQFPTTALLVNPGEHLASETGPWNDLLQRSEPLTIPPHTTRRVIIDLGNYYTAYTDLATSGGQGAIIRSWWAESLYSSEVIKDPNGNDVRLKGHRDEIAGKIFDGIGDTFEPDGGPHRHFRTLWWEAGRYLELIVRTAAEPLILEQFSLRETHYPIEWRGQFTASDPRLDQVIPVAQRALEMCSHETYMDCPYYEQLMYVGDTRLEVLTTYTWTTDDRLPRKALRLFDESRKAPGFTQSRYPSRLQQTIPPFSAWWIGMLHDYMMWRGGGEGRALVMDLLPGMHAILDAFSKWKNRDGLVSGPHGWNFFDWVPTWQYGMPTDADTGISAILNLQLAWINRQAAELETYAGTPELAAYYRRQAAELTQACDAFWDESRGLYADDLAHQHFSEHAQCLALLGQSASPPHRERIIAGLLSAPDLARATIYFSHYLFEVFAQIGRPDLLIDRLGLWFDHTKNGLKTTIEAPEPTRSDCHAWGAHPIYHYLTTLLGIRPAVPGFAAVSIRPQPGPLTTLRGALPHPRGLIEVDVSQKNGQITGSVRLPQGLDGTLYLPQTSVPLKPGLTKF